MIRLQEKIHDAILPSTWTTSKLRALLRLRKENKNLGLREQNLLSLSYGKIVRKDIETSGGLLPDSFETYQIVKPGDIILRLTDLQNDKRSLRQGLVLEDGIITSAYDALSVSEPNDPRFWFYALLALDLAKYYYSLGGGVRQSIGFKDFPNEWIGVPPPTQQKEIADLLDKETARIDDIINKKNSLLAIISEKRQVVITEAATKGIAQGARMKSSGVPWFGEVPEHWRVCRFLRLIESVVDYRGRTPEKVASGIFLVTARNIRDGFIDYSRSEEFTTLEAWQELSGRGMPRIGDVLFTTEAPLGEVASVDREDVAFAQRIIKFRGRRGEIDNEYLKFLLMSSPFQYSLYIFSSGSTAKGIKAERLAHLFGLWPPFSEQQLIAASIKERLGSLDAASVAVLRSREKLSEFRSAFITAAVTGQVDARTWRGRGHTARLLDQIETEATA